MFFYTCYDLAKNGKSGTCTWNEITNTTSFTPHVIIIYILPPAQTNRCLPLPTNLHKLYFKNPSTLSLILTQTHLFIHISLSLSHDNEKNPQSPKIILPIPTSLSKARSSCKIERLQENQSQQETAKSYELIRTLTNNTNFSSFLFSITTEFG